MGLIQGKITMANGAEIPFELYPDEAPITVAHFVKLIKEGYYNGKTFQRVIPHFVSQGGCPYGTGAGDLGYTIPCETKNNPHKHIAGAMSMACLLYTSIVDAVGILHAGGEIVQAAAHLFDGVMDRVVELGIGQFRIVCKVHEKSPLYVPIVASLCKKFNNLVYKLK